MLKFVPDSFAPVPGTEEEKDIQDAVKDYEDLQAIAKKYSSKIAGRDNSNSQRFIQNKDGSSFKN
jgi:hypothetical protein